jgi:hypothetical protein
MRLPTIRVAIGLYAGLLALDTIPQLVAHSHPFPHWLLVAFSVPSVLAVAALFVAAFTINDRLAVLVPIAGTLGQTLLIHYLAFEPKGYRAAGLDRVHLPHELWATIKHELLVGLLVAGAAIWLAQRVWIRVSEDPPRIDLPELDKPAIAFAASLLVSTALEIVRTHGHFDSYTLSLILAAVNAALLVSYFLVNAIGYSPWVLPLPIFLVFQEMLVFLTQPGADCGFSNDCAEFLWPIIRNLLAVYVAVSAAALLAGWWARREPAPTLN